MSDNLSINKEILLKELIQIIDDNEDYIYRYCESAFEYDFESLEKEFFREAVKDFAQEILSDFINFLKNEMPEVFYSCIEYEINIVIKNILMGDKEFLKENDFFRYSQLRCPNKIMDDLRCAIIKSHGDELQKIAIHNLEERIELITEGYNNLMKKYGDKK